MQRRQSGGSTIAGKGLSPQWSLNGRHWSAERGTMVVQVGQKHRWNWLIHRVYNSKHFFYLATNGRPLCIHSVTMRMLVPSSCLLLWPVSDLPHRRHLCDCLNILKTLRRAWQPWVHGEVWTSSVPPLNDQGNHSASLAFIDALVGFVVAQERRKGRSRCVKGVAHNALNAGCYSLVDWKCLLITELLCMNMIHVYVFLLVL